MNQSLDQKRNLVVSGCIILSLFVHALLLAFVQTHSLWFCASAQTLSTMTSNPIQMVPANQILKETFASLPSSSAASIKPEPQNIRGKLAYSFQHDQLSVDPFSFSTSLFPQEPMTPLLQEIHWTPLSVKMPTYVPSFLEGLILPTLHVLQNPPAKSNESPTLHSEVISSSLQIPAKKDLPELFLDPLTFVTEKDLCILPKEEPDSISRSSSFVPLPELPKFLTLYELNTVNLSDAFNTELTFLAKPDQTGYLFALTVIPREDLELPKFQQRITFLIDRSNSIQRDRLLTTKQAILRALDELEEEDQFNIIVFDSKTEKLFPFFSPATQSALLKAEDFLDHIQLGSFFATSDLYRPLLHTIPSVVQDHEVYTTLLLTNGESLSSKALRQSLLHDWTLQNQGKVSLYIVGLETDPHSEILETLCTLNRGRYIASSTQKGLKRQILKLAKNIKTPLAKDLSTNVICRTSDHRIEIYPQPNFSPNLYLNQPK